MKISCDKILNWSLKKLSYMDDSMINRVAIYIPSFGRGGVERFVINLSAAMIEQNVAVDVLTYETSEMTSQLPEAVNVIHLSRFKPLDVIGNQFPTHVGNAITSFSGYISYLNNRSPEILISTQTSPFAVLGACITQTDATVVVRESNTPSVATTQPQHLTGKFAPLAKRLAYPRANQVVAVSEDAETDIINWLGLSKDQVTTIYNPTYTQDLLESASADLDHPWFDSEDPIIVSVGRFVEQKDFETVIRAISQLQSRQEVRLVLIGDGQKRMKLEALCTELGAESVVDFLGYQSNPHKYVAKADVFVFSSYYEGLPNSLVEAIAVDTPAVSTDCPSGPREVLFDGEGGHLIPVGDVDAMVDAIQDYLTNPEEAQAQLERAKEGLDRFTPDRAAQEYLQLRPIE
jgi:glycosyltransferase involved in cell wall biosynthesis